MPAHLVYRQLLIVGAVVVLYSGLIDYLFTSGVSPAPPLYAIVGLAIVAMPLMLERSTLVRVLRHPVSGWAAFYLALTLVAFMWSSQSEIAWGELRLRVLAVLFLGAMAVLLVDPRTRATAQRAIVGCVVAGVALNLVDFVRPQTFSPIVGRAAGLYINPNTSAIALVVGMVVAIDVVFPRLRSLFVGVIGLGVLLTLSRGGIITWFVATLFVVLSRRVRVRSLAAVCGVLAGIAIVALRLSGWWEAAVELPSIVAADHALSRLTLSGEFSDASAGVRFGAARLAWQMFLERPIFGWGVGATLEWEWPESTHNIYLRHAAEYGVVGLLIVPALAWAMLRRLKLHAAPAAGGVVAVIMVWGLFSHNLLDERHVLLAIAVASFTRLGREPANTIVNSSGPERVEA